MRKTFQLSIPVPCTRDWDTMPANGCSRYCGSCKKTVIDFSGMDDETFIRYVQQSKTIHCGRFTQQQLSLQIPYPTLRLLPFKKWHKYVAASLFTTVTLASKAGAQQTTPVKEQTVVQHEGKDAVGGPTGETEVILTGIVTNIKGEPVAGASVVVPYYKNGTQTDEDGRFWLLVPRTSKSCLLCNLSIHYYGYETVDMRIDVNQVTPLYIVLKQPEILDGVVVYTKRTKWQRFKSRVRKLFR